MNLLLVVILKVLIANTLQNLIRFGDFQNLVPSTTESFSYCNAYCNGIWYTSPNRPIQLQLNPPAVGKNRVTTCVDMIFNGYFKLCQDFKTVEIGKNYKYGFDIHCNKSYNIQSYSLWVILNGQAINGSNQTRTDPMSHYEGYINITRQNNTICIQQRQVPYFNNAGIELDNVTLQIYTGKIPCNVLDCKLCKLNFPNICQVFQQPKEAETAGKTQALEGSSCQSKFYLYGNICKVCLFPCEACQGQSRKCLSCTKFYRLQQNQCVMEDEWTFAASMIASMPGIEFFSIGQTFLGISDQFWPYYSHHRVYGQQTVEILTFFHTLQNNKWFLLSLDKKIDFTFQSLNFSDYTGYSNQQFLRMESKTSYFWDGVFEFTFFSFPTTLIVFFAFNLIFYLTFEYRISRHFRPFNFLLVIYFLGIGEEISYLSFLSFSNGINLFFFKFQDKLGHIVWIFFFFLLVLYCSGAYFLAKILYNKLSKYFVDGFFPKIQSFHILSCLSMKAFVIGSANALLAKNYEALIISLGSIETTFLIGVIYLQWKNRCYKIQTFMFLQMLKSIIMAIFNISLWIDWKIRVSLQDQTEQQTKKLLDFNCKALVIVIIGLGILQTIAAYFSGREMLNHKRQNQVPESKKRKKQVLKIINIKQSSQAKRQMPAKQQTIDQGIYLYPNTHEKPQKTKEKEKIKIKKVWKQNPNALSIIRQQDEQNEQYYS